MRKQEQNLQMRRALLTAAGKVFAEKGFARATVRAICDQAGANVAAVNYYFGDKVGLYHAAIKHWSEISRQKYPSDFKLGPNPTAEERLAAFIWSFLLRILDKSRPGWHGKWLAREMVEPTAALDELVESIYRPMNERLRLIVRELGGGAARRNGCAAVRAQHFGTMSVLSARRAGQCAFGSGRDLCAGRCGTARDARDPVFSDSNHGLGQKMNKEF